MVTDVAFYRVEESLPTLKDMSRSRLSSILENVKATAGADKRAKISYENRCKDRLRDPLSYT